MAISTAAWLTDAVARLIAVSVRARLPVSSAWRNSRFSVGLGAALGLRQLPRRAHLAEDLALAEHRRVEPGGDLEQVGDGSVVVLAVEVRVQLVGGEAAELAEEVADVGVGAVEALGDGVDLGAVARAEHDGLADVVARPTRPAIALPWADRSGATATRSSNDSGPVRWLTPMTTMDMTDPTYALALAVAAASRRRGWRRRSGAARSS